MSEHSVMRSLATRQPLESSGAVADVVDATPSTADDERLRGSRHPPFPAVTSKVAPPVTRHGSVIRGALVERLQTYVEVPIIAVVAPAGYGKTTLLRQWADRDPRPFTWLGLDGHDNDPTVLLTYLALALDRIVPVDDAVFRSLAAPRDSTSTVVAHLTRALGRLAEPAVLVVDDLHMLDCHECQDILAAVVNRMPSGWQVAIASREELELPVARLRAEGRIAELGPSDLAMDDEEAGELLAAVDAELSQSAVAALNRRVEGWPAALYLAALAIALDPDLDPTAAWPVGSDRFLVDYLQSEVLSRLSTSDVQFLIRTSLTERLSGPLCDAMLGSTGSAARLDTLERSNMLVVPVDHERSWYRCHHVFRDLLIAELHRRDPDRVPVLRGRAADWYEVNDMPELAIEQAMALNDGGRVARIATAWAQAFYQHGRATTARRWLDWIDEHGLIEAHPKLAVVGSLAHIVDGRVARAERWMDAAERGAALDEPAPVGTPTFDGELAMLRAAMCRGGFEAMRRDAEDATRLVPSDHPMHAPSLLLLGIAHLLTDQPERADVVLAHAVEVAEDRGASPSAAIALTERALLALRAAQSTEARTFAEQASAVVAEAGLGDYALSALVYAVAARIRLEQGDVHSAKTMLAEAQRLRPHLTHIMPFYAVQARLELARCYVALTDVSGARTVLREAEEIVRMRPRLGGLIDEIAAVKRQLESLRVNMAGASSLTSAELRLLPLLPTHLSFRQIGQRLFISPHTVKTEAISIYRKLGVSSRSEAIERAQRLGLLPSWGSSLLSGRR
jgi:LuxR family maltose regulon positive regulatory protein